MFGVDYLFSLADVLRIYKTTILGPSDLLRLTVVFSTTSHIKTVEEAMERKKTKKE